MGAMTAAILGLTAVQMSSQIGQGYAQKEEAKFNSTILQGQADMIQTKSDIEYGQYQRFKGQTMSKSIANTAAMGIMPRGSVLAAMLDAQTQINIDQAIGQFNFKQEKNYTLAQKNAEVRRGRAAVYSGWSSAFSTLLSGASSAAMYSGAMKPDMGGGGISQYGNKYGINTPKGTFDMGTYSKITRR